MSDSIPKKCKAAVFEEAGKDLIIKDVDVPQPQKGEVLIKVIACGVCHSDSMFGKGAFGPMFPRIPGHEVIGEVVKLGDAVDKWQIGDRVGGPWHGGHDGMYYCRNQ